MQGLAPSDGPALDRIRRLGALTEVLHAVVYFAPEPLKNYSELGLRGYWRGYFASRAAALGRPSAALVTAVFGGFAPAFVARAVPEVWTIATPEDVLRARVEGATAALRHLLNGADVQGAAEATDAVIDTLDLAGRPMAAAHASAPRPDDPLTRLWHACTVLREHRGDGHLAVITSAGLAWPVPHLLAAGRVDRRQQALRGWDDEQWGAAAVTATHLDSDLADSLERQTDRVAASAYAEADTEELVALLSPLAHAVVENGGVPFPNPMGLRRPL